MERVKIFIDGANFNYGIKSIEKRFTDFHFDFKRFCEFICKKRQLVGINYYNASLKQDINPSLFKSQQIFFSRLRNDGISLILCKRQKRTDVNNQEYFTIKGDDINIAVDMVSGAYENEYDVAILISGDGDFKSAVLRVRKINKKVENYYFPKLISLDLLTNCDLSI
ncbi:MAG: NYN domain-containing protein, partial [Candidatus Nanoarchaeia archaeon]|nr:NYN domain-containing protein [Candidatus Nanoarchaeia archaeon]